MFGSRDGGVVVNVYSLEFNGVGIVKCGGGLGVVDGGECLSCCDCMVV